MQWLGLGTDALLAGIGIFFLLIGYRVIGKSPEGAPAHTSTARISTYKVVGWCLIAMALIGLLSDSFSR
jgi:hypothetical protein